MSDEAGSKRVIDGTGILANRVNARFSTRFGSAGASAFAIVKPMKGTSLMAKNQSRVERERQFQKESDAIDEASEESFPASDPPSHVPVTSSGCLAGLGMRAKAADTQSESQS